MKRKLLFFVSEDWYFCSHRLPLAVAAVRKGYEVAVLCRVDRHQQIIERESIRVIPLEVNRSDTGLWSNLKLLWRLVRVLRLESPDILHNVAQKPVILGTLAAKWTRIPKIVNALGGLGVVFTSSGIKSKLMRVAMSFAYRRIFASSNTILILQNRDDFFWFTRDLSLQTERTQLIRGAGIDLESFSFSEEPKRSPPRVVMVARLLRDKGVVEFLEAAALIRAKGVEAEFVLVGDPDNMNPNTLTESEVKRLAEPGDVSCWGRRSDIADIWRDAHISVLPSYREGLPKSLLESSAVGRPMVTTDVPGCREVVTDGYNGYLVPPRDSNMLADRIIRLIQDPELRRKFGQRSRARAEKEFSSDKVITDTMAIYDQQNKSQPDDKDEYETAQ